METKARAPRLEAYWVHVEGKSVFSMARSAWDAFETSGTNVAVIDVTHTPIGSVAEQSSVLAAVAQHFSPDEGRISICRHDPNDSEPINVDHSWVHLNLGRSPLLPEMITAASTSYNENMENYLRQHVHLVKEEPALIIGCPSCRRRFESL